MQHACINVFFLLPQTYQGDELGHPNSIKVRPLNSSAILITYLGLPTGLLPLTPPLPNGFL